VPRMSGLSFLSKKSWHTSNLKNQERVWVEEQRKEAEDAKLEEFKAQLEEERELDRLRELQENSGLIKRDAHAKGKLAWMYRGTEDEKQEKELTAECPRKRAATAGGAQARRTGGRGGRTG